MTTRKRGRPASTAPTVKRVALTLDAERARQLEELHRHIAGSDSAVIGTAISTQHAKMKKERPDDFS